MGGCWNGGRAVGVRRGGMAGVVDSMGGGVAAVMEEERSVLGERRQLEWSTPGDGKWLNSSEKEATRGGH